MYHHEPRYQQTMHKSFGWFGSWVFCVGGFYGGFSSSLSELMKLCGVEQRADIELLNMAQKQNKRVEKKAEPLQRLL